MVNRYNVFAKHITFRVTCQAALLKETTGSGSQEPHYLHYHVNWAYEHCRRIFASAQRQKNRPALNNILNVTVGNPAIWKLR